MRCRAEFSRRADDYIDLVCDEIIPAAASQGLADAVDAFCDTIGFTAAQTRRVFVAARAQGLPVKLHADQLSDTGGAALAAEFDALSADHVEYTSDAGVEAMARAGTVAVLLPGAFYALRETRLPPIARAARAGRADGHRLRLQSRNLARDLAAADAQHGVHAVPPDPGGSAGRSHAARGARAGAAPTAARLSWVSVPTSRSGTSCRRRSFATGSAAIACRGIIRGGQCRALAGPMKLFEIERGESPLVVDVPHAGTYVPPALAARLTPAARAFPDTDWHVEKLFGFARRAGVTLIAATHSRYVVDLNRDPSGRALYPGADNTELCPDAHVRRRTDLRRRRRA